MEKLKKKLDELEYTYQEDDGGIITGRPFAEPIGGAAAVGMHMLKVPDKDKYKVRAFALSDTEGKLKPMPESLRPKEAMTGRFAIDSPVGTVAVFSDSVFACLVNCELSIDQVEPALDLLPAMVGMVLTGDERLRLLMVIGRELDKCVDLDDEEKQEKKGKKAKKVKKERPPAPDPDGKADDVFRGVDRISAVSKEDMLRKTHALLREILTVQVIAAAAHLIKFVKVNGTVNADNVASVATTMYQAMQRGISTSFMINFTRCLGYTNRETVDVLKSALDLDASEILESADLKVESDGGLDDLAAALADALKEV